MPEFFKWVRVKTNKLKKYLILFTSILLTHHLFAQPTITSFAPTAGPIGTTVTINGSNFSSTPSNNIVYFGAVKAAVSAASNNSLSVTVPRGATYQPISLTTNYLTAYSSQPFILTFSGGGSLSPSSFTISNSLNLQGATAALVADLDGDGKADLIATSVNYTRSDYVSIFRNTGSPGAISFTADIQFALAGQNSNIAIGDVNGDGMPDLLITNYYLSTVTIYQNTSTPGVISFDGGTQFPTVNPNIISTSDVDGDGKLDLIVTSYSAGTISILRNTGVSGTLSFAPKTDLTIPLYTVSLAIADLDGDGKPDIAVASSILNKISLFKNTSSLGVISYNSAAQYSLFGQLRKIVVADFDGDGKPDLAVINDSTSAVFMFKNTGALGNISFASETTVNTSSQPIDIGVSDFDGNGKPDISSTLPNQNSISILPNTSSPGNISFGAGVNYIENKTPYFIAIGDFDGDGKTDVASTDYFDNSIAIFRNTATNSGPPPQIISFKPDSARGGTTVIIRGKNFTRATSVSFGGVAANSFTVVSDSTVSAIIGTGASGNISVTTLNGTDSLSGFVFITAPLPPVIKSFAPDSGSTGTRVTILGRYFTGTTSISFGGVAAASFMVNTDSSITVTVGGGASGSVTVSTSIGLDSLSGFTFILPVLPAPLINSFSPSFGSLGTNITINGKYFTGTTSVSFGGSGATSYSVIADTSIIAIVGTGATGNVRVTTANGSDTLGGFIYTKGLMMHPNPATGHVVVTFPTTASISQLKLTDLTGRVIISVNISPNVSQAVLDLTGIMPGVYLIIWTNGTNVLEQKLLIE